MSGSVWHKAAGLSGAAAVALGAYSAHQFKPEDPYFVEVHGNRYLTVLEIMPHEARPME